MSIILDKTLSNAGYIVSSARSIFSTIKKLSSPFIYGFFIAYLICPIVTFLEKICFIHIPLLKNKVRVKRTIAILITYIVAIGCIVWLTTYFLPEITTTLSNVLLPQNILAFEDTLVEFINNNNFIGINSEDASKLLNNLFSPLLVNSTNIPVMLQKILDSTVIAASTLLNAIMGIFIGFYMLFDKEAFGSEFKKILYTFFDETKTDRFLNNVKRVHTIFQSFIVGKTIDSVIIGIICFAGMNLMNLMKMPYITIISLIVGLTNMIPYFGPFIGAVPAVLITLLIEPGKAIWVALFILALQQFDGIILGPKILGNSTGVSPMWIILAIIVGGALMGPLGMFLGVPVFASFKMFFSEYVEERYSKKYFFHDTNATESNTQNKEKK